MKDHIVNEGECLASIAFESGFFHEALWNHPKNSALKNLRQSPHILNPGDVVHIPDLREKEVPVQTGKRHVFRRRGVPEILNLRLLDEGKPRAGLPYVIFIDGASQHGKTDSQGQLRHYLPPNAQECRLVLDPESDSPEEMKILLRLLDPVETVRGVQARLKNLDLYEGAVDGIPSAGLRGAIFDFQQSCGIELTGEADALTQDRLMQQHGS